VLPGEPSVSFFSPPPPNRGSPPSVFCHNNVPVPHIYCLPPLEPNSSTCRNFYQALLVRLTPSLPGPPSGYTGFLVALVTTFGTFDPDLRKNLTSFPAGGAAFHIIPTHVLRLVTPPTARMVGSLSSHLSCVVSSLPANLSSPSFGFFSSFYRTDKSPGTFLSL